MAWTTNPYCQLSDIHSALGLQSTADDTWIQNTLIPEAQAYLDRAIGYPFQQDGTPTSPATRYYSGNGTNTIYIDDIISLKQVLETNYNLIVGSNGVWQNSAPTVMDITADCVLGPDNYPLYDKPAYLMKRLSGNPFYEGIQNYQVFGVFGQPTIPLDITRACIRLVTHYYKMRETSYADMVSTQGNVRERYNKQCPPDVEEIIRHYKRRLFLTR
jgi:hypothetical protein